jgi:diacylglycerol kinase family enzyme
MTGRPAGMSVIINERSGAARNPDVGVQVQSLFGKHGLSVRLERVRDPADLPARARQAASRGDVIVAAGGDGTVSAVAGVAVETRATIGVLPMGTLNHFAKDLGLPTDLEQAVAAIAAGHTRDVDVGEVNGRVFVNNSSVGLYPRMVWERNVEQRRGRTKWTAFAIAMMRTWRNYRTITAHLVVEGKAAVVRTPFIFVGNNHYIAEGFQLGGRSRLDEGRLSVYMAPECGRFEILSLPVRALVRKLESAELFVEFPAETLTVDVPSRRVSVALDGEVALSRSPLEYRIRLRALKAIVP